jgi:DNA-binding XRE family transcriptional regulator
MTTPRPPRPPAMRLIEQRRERLGMSKRAAAAIAGISESRYRQLEDGGRQIRGVWVDEEAPDMTLARMALAVRLAPSDVEPFSPRAALMLADLIAERSANGRQDAEDAARMVDALGGRALSGRQRAALEAEVAESLRRLRDG